MGKLVAICATLFVLAIGFVVLTQGRETAALFDAFRAQPLQYQAAWAVIVLVPLVLLPAAVWLSDTLVRQRKAAKALEIRLDGARQGVKALTQSQVDIEAAVHQLARSDPEDAIGVVQQRLAEAERFAHAQQQRNEAADLQSRVDNIRAQQKAMQDRLAPVVEKRRYIEQLFTDLDSRQGDIDRTLAEIASGDDGVEMEVRLQNLTGFLKQGNQRCDDIDLASRTVAKLKDDYAALQVRIAPYAAAEGGITGRIRELNEARDRLAANIEALERSPEGLLVDRVQRFADDNRKLADGIAQLDAQFARLVTLRRDAGVLFVNLNRALRAVSAAPDSEDAADADARVEELRKFIDDTQGRFDEIERRMTTFGQLRTKLGELQARLAPFEAENGGVVNVIDNLKDARDRLAARIRNLEQSDEGDLTERVKLFSDTKRELENRVALLSDQFLKLAAIRKDIAGLFDKLGTAVSDSAN